jgi:hypothetical protein
MSVIDMRPVYRQTADCARARLPGPSRHRKELQGRAPRSLPEALTILKSIRVVDIDLGTAPQNARSPIGIINRRSDLSKINGLQAQKGNMG